TYDDLSAAYEDTTVIPLFVLREGETLEIVSETSQFQLRPDDQFVALVGTGVDVRDQDHKTPEVDRGAKREGPALEKATPNASDGAS
ncbi:MAG: cation:proton antiporter, partial [Salinibacter sp.]